MMDALRVAWVQHTAEGCIEQNLAALDVMLEALSLHQPQLVVLPEAFSWLQKRAEVQRDWAEVLGDGTIQTWIADWAKKLNCFVVAGSIPIKEDQQIYASLIVFNHQGAIETSYRKMHLFSVHTPDGQVFQESTVFSAGTMPVVWQSPWGAIGLAICFDLRFPELFIAYRQQGVRMLLLPAAFTNETGQAHWHCLVRARAIEQQMFVLAVNQTGQHEQGMVSYGHSLLINPWGDVMVDSGKEVTTGFADINLMHANNLRQQFPLYP